MLDYFLPPLEHCSAGPGLFAWAPYLRNYQRQLEVLSIRDYQPLRWDPLGYINGWRPRFSAFRDWRTNTTTKLPRHDRAPWPALQRHFERILNSRPIPQAFLVNPGCGSLDAFVPHTEAIQLWTTDVFQSFLENFGAGFAPEKLPQFESRLRHAGDRYQLSCLRRKNAELGHGVRLAASGLLNPRNVYITMAVETPEISFYGPHRHTLRLSFLMRSGVARLQDRFLELSSNPQPVRGQRGTASYYLKMIARSRETRVDFPRLYHYLRNGRFARTGYLCRRLEPLFHALPQSERSLHRLLALLWAQVRRLAYLPLRVELTVGQLCNALLWVFAHEKNGRRGLVLRGLP